MTRARACSKVPQGLRLRGRGERNSSEMVTIKAGPLTDLVGEIFAKSGCSAAEAARIGKYLVSANLTGHDSHGVARVPRYLQWKRDGVVHADRAARIVTETPVDGTSGVRLHTSDGGAEESRKRWRPGEGCSRRQCCRARLGRDVVYGCRDRTHTLGDTRRALRPQCPPP